jgi:hypothetical protein
VLERAIAGRPPLGANWLTDFAALPGAFSAAAANWKSAWVKSMATFRIASVVYGIVTCLNLRLRPFAAFIEPL